MRAAVWQRPGEIVLEDRPDPEPGPGENVVSVGACGMCGTDLQIAAGEFPLGGFEDALAAMRGGEGVKVQVLPNG